MANFLSNSIGRTVSNQQAPNFLASRYGGPCVEHRVELLVEAYLTHSGNECLLLEDADGVLCGIVMINAAQKELYKWWGETLPLNWTHHSNNLGFHLGELMITAGNGLGISVCDMLVADQLFVIDKDFNERRVLNDIYKEAKQRDGIEVAWRWVVHAKSHTSFQKRWTLLVEKCAEVSFVLPGYFRSNWYECRDMWAAHARSKFYSVGNTTTNRLEATWKHMKTMMNLNSTFDKCLSAILLYQVQVLRALKSDLILVDSKSHFYPNDPHALQHVSSVLSSYAYGLVRDQYQLFGTSCSSAKAVPTRLLESEWSIAL
ncbi:hypothetical protein F441_03809 [Phytophthora nicotianae CJ01A1]|uniref:ZSWIM1/3 RNaseH-like domain-containing protein n=1 Tax=Phytophthora nicotianae CJ01A1 TaxID=1317063 RepID=W2XM28_PHYNI|nr:hypothetical protein F441_03809 [Phytophthora nicotianae CJ01A1]